LGAVFFHSKIKNYKEIPIIINNRNRLRYLMQLIDFLRKSGYTNIIILDNDSTYPPLLEYYQMSSYKIVYLKENLGHMALNKCDLYNEVKNDYFVYTDPDILPLMECPADFIKHFLNIMKKDFLIQKAGFSLKIDDLPDYYDKKQKVIDWESQFWKDEIFPGVYQAAIDTTFALHRPHVKSSLLSKHIKHCRTGYPYQARHLPWYEDSNNPSEESIFYHKHANMSNNW
jgi:hypothetical protein